MNVNSVRSEGWEDTVALLVMTIGAVFFWYANDWYVNWIAIIAGIGVGVILVMKYEWADRHSVAGFLVTMLFVIAMIASIMVEELVSGVVAALVVATVIKMHKVYT